MGRRDTAWIMALSLAAGIAGACALACHVDASSSTLSDIVGHRDRLVASGTAELSRFSSRRYVRRDAGGDVLSDTLFEGSDGGVLFEIEDLGRGTIRVTCDGDATTWQESGAYVSELLTRAALV